VLLEKKPDFNVSLSQPFSFWGASVGAESIRVSASPNQACTGEKGGACKHS